MHLNMKCRRVVSKLCKFSLYVCGVFEPGIHWAEVCLCVCVWNGLRAFFLVFVDTSLIPELSEKIHKKQKMTNLEIWATYFCPSINTSDIFQKLFNQPKTDPQNSSCIPVVLSSRLHYWLSIIWLSALLYIILLDTHSSKTHLIFQH